MVKITVRVSLGKDSYDIKISYDFLSSLGKEVSKLGYSSKAVVITNTTIADLYKNKIIESLNAGNIESITLVVPDGEKYKSLKTASFLYDKLIESHIRRNNPLIAFGGGVVGDLAGFVAATYMRGIPLIQVPTTLLAQVDSSVGGKVAVNHPLGKNMIGCFYQPKLVFIDTDILKTLPLREYRAGLAEVIKYGFIQSKELLELLDNSPDKILNKENDVLLKVIAKCCEIKARIVEEDEKDFGKRAILNYGHTIGHAIESLTKYKKLLHGEAISIGMAAAANIACQMKLIDAAVVEKHKKILTSFGLPIKIPQKITLEEILERIKLDKKKKQETESLVLLKKIGEAEVFEVPKELIAQALENTR
ncbi:MAG: 3-dehydroquinate synthase [Actinobacteria bacterium]|nr:3-dehydroquinate synthase [Actinomycetota bacterium]